MATRAGGDFEGVVGVDDLLARMLDLAEELAKNADRMQRELHQAHLPDFSKAGDSSPVRDKPKHIDLPSHKPKWDKKRPELNLKSAPASPPMIALREEFQRLGQN